MLTTVTLWTLLVWAEPRRSSNALAATQVPGFATREACLTAMGVLRESNSVAQASSSRSRIGETGLDIKLMTCIPVLQERNQDPG